LVVYTAFLISGENLKIGRAYWASTEGIIMNYSYAKVTNASIIVVLTLPNLPRIDKKQMVAVFSTVC
jgi:hypothetical protein